MRWKALAEIHKMHSFAPFLESIIENWGKKDLAKTTPKRYRSLSSIFYLKIPNNFANLLPKN